MTILTDSSMLTILDQDSLKHTCRYINNFTSVRYSGILMILIGNCTGGHTNWEKDVLGLLELISHYLIQINNYCYNIA